MISKYLNADWKDVIGEVSGGWVGLAICDPIYSDSDLSYIPAMTKILRPGGSIYVFSDASGVVSTKLALDSEPDLIFQNWLIWGPNDWGGRSHQRWGQKHDDILFYTKKGAKHHFDGGAVAVPKKMTQPVFNPSGRTTKIPNSVWTDLAGFSTLAKERIKVDGKGVSWQKPEALIRRIVLASSKPNDMVVDPFAGVATIPLVCHQLHRKFHSTEVDAKIFKAGSERLRKAING